MPLKTHDLEGFAMPSKESEDVDGLNSDGNKKKNSRKGGGFQCLGLNYKLLKGILKKGYKVPTPIQRKSIPIVMSGRDVVAMARTGSGKTACFLIPLFERLKSHSPATGARALILTPTRELAIQTYKFIKDLGRYLDFRTALVLGGESMDYQFSVMHTNPDIIVATPGRFYHLCVEMDMKLNSIEYVVFDEADRLFEMGFGEQVNDILKQLPDSRQTVLFSATLPRVLVDFARAGLNDPVLLRLDVESNLPELLKLVFLYCKDEDKTAALVMLLKQIIRSDTKTAVFAATKQHVEYLHMILTKSGISNTYVYSDLDPAARKINIAKFAKGIIKVLVVTDIAARGIDIPFLDNVINYNFPAKAKLFVHRVGRCARAGRSGTAYTLVCRSEMPYFLDLHLFLGRSVNKAKPLIVKKEENVENVDSTEDGIVGYIPRSILEEEQANLDMYENSPDFEKLKNSCQRAYSHYLQHRPGASVESVRRHKDLSFEFNLGPHPIFNTSDDLSLERDKEVMLGQMKLYRPKGTIFELGRNADLPMFHAMKEKRKFHSSKIDTFHLKLEQNILQKEDSDIKVQSTLPSSSQRDIDETFSTVVDSVKREDSAGKSAKRRKVKGTSVDKEHYIPYDPADKHVEAGLAVNFAHDANSSVLDLTGDTNELMRQKRQQMKWDVKRKKMVQINPEKKVTMIKTESGQRIQASYKTGRYEKWQNRNKIEKTLEEDENDYNNVQPQIKSLAINPHTHWGRHNMKLAQKQRNVMLKTKDQIAKKRMQKEAVVGGQKKREDRRKSRRKKNS